MTTLPEASRSKLLTIVMAADDARALASDATRRIVELRKAEAVQAQLVAADAAHDDEHPDQPKPLQHRRDEDQLKALQHEIQTLVAAQQSHQRNHSERAQLANNVQLWLEQHPRLSVAPPVTPTIHESESVDDALSRLRDEIVAGHQHLVAVRAAPLPRSDLQAKLAAHVQQLAVRGRPTVNAAHGELSVSFGDQRAFAPPSRDQQLMTFAWLLPDLVTRALTAELERLPEPKLTLTAAEKSQRIAELAARVDGLEREEEALIEMAARNGREISRRPEASPAAILGVVTEATRANVAA